jgi:hypothetical protein
MNGRWNSDPKRLALISVFLGLGISSSQLHAQAIIAPSGRTLFNRASLVRSFAEIDRFSVNAAGNSVRGAKYVTPLALVYGFYPKWTVIAAQPYVVTDVTIRTGNQTQHQGLNGFADTQFFVQYDGLYSRNTPGGLTRLSGVFGLQAPTGAARFSTGAFEYTGGLIFEWVAKLKYAFTVDFEYTFATENGRGLSVGNGARFDAVPAYFIISRETPPADASWLRKAYHRVFRNGAYGILEFNGAWHGHETSQGTEIHNTGGTTLLISPGIQYFPSRTLVVEFSVPIPAVTELNGIQPKPKTSFLVGFRYLF